MTQSRLIASIMGCFLVMASYAQSVSFIHVSSDARSAAMGNAGYAMPATAFATHYNGAGMLFGNKAAVGASYVLWQPDNGLLNLGGTYRLNDTFALGAGVRYNTLSKILRMDESGNPMGHFTPTEYAVDFGIAYRLTTGLGVSATFRYIGSDMGGPSSGSAFAADVDAMYKVNRLIFGMGVSNIGSKIDYGYTKYELPARVKTGASYQLSLQDKHHWTGSAELDYQIQPSDFSGMNAGVGVEYMYRTLFALRGGYYTGDKDRTGPGYVSLGCGINYAGVVLDFAYLLAGSDSALKNTTFISLSWRLVRSE